MATARKPKSTPARVMRDRRLAAGLSQAELARHLGVSQPAISGFESGRASRGGPWLSKVKLWAFAQRFGIDPAVLGLSEHEHCPTCGRPLA